MVQVRHRPFKRRGQATFRRRNGDGVTLCFRMARRCMMESTLDGLMGPSSWGIWVVVLLLVFWQFFL